MATDAGSPEHIKHHYKVKKELTGRLCASSTKKNNELLKTLCTELSDRVSDQRNSTDAATLRRKKLITNPILVGLHQTVEVLVAEKSNDLQQHD